MLDRGRPVDVNDHTVSRATRSDRELKIMFSRSGVTACAATVLSWSGGVAPYSLIIVFSMSVAAVKSY